MLAKIFDLFSLVRYFEFMFNVTKKLATPLEPIMMSFFNWRLRPHRPQVPKRGSTLQMVIRPDERAYVGWPVIHYIIKPLIRSSSREERIVKGVQANGDVGGKVSFARLVLAIPITLVMGVIMFGVIVASSPTFRKIFFPNGLSIFELGSISTEGLVTNTIVVVVLLVFLSLLLWFVGLIWTYWRYEWERRHTVFPFFLEGVLHLEAEFIGKAVTPFFLGENKKVDTLTPTNEIREIELATDVEDLSGGEWTSSWQDSWSQYLSKKYQIQALRIGSLSTAHDIFRSVAHAPTTVLCCNEIVDMGKTYLDLHATYRIKAQEALSEDAPSGQFDDKSGSRKAKKVWENFDSIYPQPIKRYESAFELEDPGLWDRERGEKVTLSLGPGAGLPLGIVKPPDSDLNDTSEAKRKPSSIIRTEIESELNGDDEEDLFPFRRDDKEKVEVSAPTITEIEETSDPEETIEPGEKQDSTSNSTPTPSFWETISEDADE